MAVDPELARAWFAAARVARLATVDADGAPHVVPIAFAVAGDSLWTAVDGKPKAGGPLRRLANIAANPRVAVLVDEYDEDWSSLRWARADGVARLLEVSDPQARHGISLLRERYRQYADVPIPGPVIAVQVRRWSGWSAAPPG